MEKFSLYGITYIPVPLNPRTSRAIEKRVSSLTPSEINDVLRVILNHNGKLESEIDSFNPSDKAKIVITDLLRNERYALNLLAYLFFQEKIQNNWEISAAVVLAKIGRLKLVENFYNYSLEPRIKDTINFFYSLYWHPKLLLAPCRKR